MGDLPWYKDGLRFKCTGCGKCCTGGPGVVWITEEEMIVMAELLSISVELFRRRYIRFMDNRFALVERKITESQYDCVFLKDNKCSVYQARPSQCRTYPWWTQNLNSQESWDLAAQECEGINNDAPLVPYSQIIANDITKS